MADTRVLLRGLEEYQSSLARHLIMMRTEYAQLENRWFSFSQVYEGDAADQFRTGWLRTADRFNEYQERTQAILLVLDERIEALRAANATDTTI